MPGDTAEEVIHKATRALVQDAARFTRHVADQMNRRNVTLRDLSVALFKATSAELQPNGTWRIKSIDGDGDDLTIVVDVRDYVRLVTVM